MVHGVNGPAYCYASGVQPGSSPGLRSPRNHFYDTSRVLELSLWNGSGGIWFSNNWVVTPPATMEQLLGGLNLVVHCDQGFARRNYPRLVGARAPLTLSTASCFCLRGERFRTRTRGSPDVILNLINSSVLEGPKEFE